MAPPEPQPKPSCYLPRSLAISRSPLSSVCNQHINPAAYRSYWIMAAAGFPGRISWMHLATKPLCDTPSVAASHFRSCLSPIPMCFWFIQYSTKRNCDEFGPIFKNLASRTMACNYFLGLFFFVATYSTLPPSCRQVCGYVLRTMKHMVVFPGPCKIVSRLRTMRHPVVFSRSLQTLN